VLRIEQLSFPRIEAEELGVETVGAVEDGACGDVVRMVNQLRIDAGIAQFLGRELADGFEASAKVAP